MNELEVLMERRVKRPVSAVGPNIDVVRGRYRVRVDGRYLGLYKNASDARAVRRAAKAA